MKQFRIHHALRRGAAMLICLALLAVIMLVGLTLLKQVVSRQQSVRAQQRRLQADYLAESAVGRAAAQFARDPQYGGETWEPTVTIGSDVQKCQAVINVKRQAESDTVTVGIIATFPLHPVNRAQASIERTISVAKAE